MLDNTVITNSDTGSFDFMKRIGKMILYRNEKERKRGIVFLSTVLALYLSYLIGSNIYFYFF